MSMLRHLLSNERYGGGPEPPRSYSVKVCIVVASDMNLKSGK